MTARSVDDLAADVRDDLADAPSPCGHPSTSVSQSGEGTAYCADCETEARRQACPHTNLGFDRTVCACGWMHTYCEGCGAQIDMCQEPAA